MNDIGIVTGGAQGIGFAVAEALVAKGTRVALWDLDEEVADGAAAKLNATVEGSAVAVRADVSDWNSVTSALKQTTAALGAPTILVNSAGLAGPNAAVEDYPLEDWKRIMDVNATGCFLLLKAILPGMKAQSYGRVVLISSVAGKEGNPMASAYSASKAAVIALTKSAGKECAGTDIAVNCVTPAAAKTRILDQMSKEHIAYMLSKIPRGRFLLVEEAAAMISWLASRENSFTTGAVFDLSGGRATY